MPTMTHRRALPALMTLPAQVSVALGQTDRIAHTGQTACYDDAGNVLASRPAEGGAFHGRLARHDGVPPHDRDNGDGTVTDLDKGLMRPKTPTPNPFSWEHAVDHGNGLTLAGYDDGRLPNAKELQSIEPAAQTKERTMRRIAKRTVWLSLAILLAAVPVASAQGRHGAPPPAPPDPVLGPAAHALRSLDLSADQRSRIGEIIDDAIAGDLGKALEQHGDARRALGMAIWSADTSEQELADANEAVAESAAALVQQQRRLALDILDVLTDEQRTAFQQALEEGPAPWEGPAGRPGPGGPGGPIGRRGPGGPGGPGQPGR